MTLHRRLHRLRSLISPKIRARLGVFKGVESDKNHLQRKWAQLIKKRRMSKTDLWLIIWNVRLEPLRTEACELLLDQKDVSIEDVYELLSIVDGELFQKACKKLLEIGIDPSELLQLIKYESASVSDWAFKQITERIKQKIISRDHAIAILIKIINDIPPRREGAWRQFKNLKPDEDELIEIASLPYSIELHPIIAEAQKMIRKLKSRHPKTKSPTKIAREIISLAERIEKQEQE